MSLSASCISICVATARSNVNSVDRISPGWPRRVTWPPRTGSYQPGKEADGHDGAYTPDRTARDNQPGRPTRADQPGEPATAGLPDGPAKANPPDRAAKALRLAHRGANGA